MSQLSKVWFIWFLMHFVGIMKVKNEFLVILHKFGGVLFMVLCEFWGVLINPFVLPSVGVP